MDYMKLVADLCQIIDRQNEITKAMVVQLGQRDALHCKGVDSKLSWTQVETGSAITWKYPSCILSGDNSTAAVSYTHLDVYKRQDYCYSVHYR